MKLAKLFCLLLLLASTVEAGKKITIEVVSVKESPTVVNGSPVMNFDAKIILPDGSHALAGCAEVLTTPCDLDNGYPERLKRTHEDKATITTGYPTFQAMRNGKELTIYTATGKRTYFIVDSW